MPMASATQSLPWPANVAWRHRQAAPGANLCSASALWVDNGGSARFKTG